MGINYNLSVSFLSSLIAMCRCDVTVCVCVNVIVENLKHDLVSIGNLLIGASEIASESAVIPVKYWRYTSSCV